MPEPERLHFPKWIFNYSVDDANCLWKWVPTEVVPPACIPPEHGALPLQIRITGNFQSVLKSSLKKGIWLKKKYIESIMIELGIPKPEVGTGANGYIKVIDLATQLVNQLFGDEASQEEKEFMIASLVTRRTVKPEESAGLLLKLTSMLDPTEHEHFDNMRKAALNELQLEQMKANYAKSKKLQKNRPEGEEERGVKRDCPEKADGSEPSSKKPRMDFAEQLSRRNVKAPPEFLDLFPLVQHCYFKWLPQNDRVTVEFTDKTRA